MRQVPSPTATSTVRPPHRTGLRLLLVGAAVLGLLAGQGTPAVADSLQDQRAKVRKALAQTKSHIKQVADDVEAASASLEESEQKLAKARKELVYVQGKLKKAREQDAEVARKLKKAEADLEKAEVAVAQGEADLAAQKELIAAVVTSAYQQQNNLIELRVLLDASSVQEIADRTQFTELVFGSTAQEMHRLEELQRQLEAAQVAREQAREDVAEQRRQSKALVAEVKALAADAATREARIERLVAENTRLRDTAQGELEATKEEYEKLEKQEAAITKKILAEAAKEKDLKVNSKGFIRPINAKPGSPFGMRYHPILHYSRMHWGLDFGAKCGSPLYAMADGKVAQVLKTSQSNGLGNWTVINYGKYKGANIASGYAHQSKIIVKPGQKVSQGQVVGYVGNTGLSTECHLHLQIYKDGVRVNPASYI
ncbi:MAG: peptidoglycan DD-metalloendopeptidase family protein [Propionibacteriaceae bacterium]|nr:peptidoglycan DD-metalloendopeptidase family protein [Propionibacteriaceae bacterium]